MTFLARQPGVGRSFVLLAPATGLSADLSPSKLRHNPDEHADLTGRMQRLRGRIYLKDGAIRAAHLTTDGRHVSLLDSFSWHLLTVSRKGRVIGCARYQTHPATVLFEEMNIRHSVLALSPEWGHHLRGAIEEDTKLARSQSLFWLEMGGWALSEELRGTTEALLYALFTYSWSQLMGGALGITTATERNGSASILRRLGGESLQWKGNPLPSYYDHQYRCVMEVLRFDSRSSGPKYQSTIAAMSTQTAEVRVIGAGEEHSREAATRDLRIPQQAARYRTAASGNFALSSRL